MDCSISSWSEETFIQMRSLLESHFGDPDTNWSKLEKLLRNQVAKLNDCEQKKFISLQKSALQLREENLSGETRTAHILVRELILRPNLNKDPSVESDFLQMLSIFKVVLGPNADSFAKPVLALSNFYRKQLQSENKEKLASLQKLARSIDAPSKGASKVDVQAHYLVAEIIRNPYPPKDWDVIQKEIQAYNLPIKNQPADPETGGNGDQNTKRDATYLRFEGEETTPIPGNTTSTSKSRFTVETYHNPTLLEAPNDDWEMISHPQEREYGKQREPDTIDSEMVSFPQGREYGGQPSALSRVDSKMSEAHNSNNRDSSNLSSSTSAQFARKSIDDDQFRKNLKNNLYIIRDRFLQEIKQSTVFLNSAKSYPPEQIKQLKDLIANKVRLVDTFNSLIEVFDLLDTAVIVEVLKQSYGQNRVC